MLWPSATFRRSANRSAPRARKRRTPPRRRSGASPTGVSGERACFLSIVAWSGRSGPLWAVWGSQDWQAGSPAHNSESLDNTVAVARPLSNVKRAGLCRGPERPSVWEWAFRGWQRRKIGIGSRLIPISHRKEVIGAVIGVAVLDSVLEIFGERDRIIGVPAVQAIPASRALRTYDERRPIVEMRERDSAIAAPEVPCAVEVILRPGARDDGLALVVHEHHFIAFAHPVILILQNAQGHSHQVPASARFGKDVVVLAVEILQLVGVAIGPPIVGGGLVRRSLAVLRVEVQHFVRERGH